MSQKIIDKMIDHANTHDAVCLFNCCWEFLVKELREQIAEDIENAVIEVAGNSAHTLNQAAAIARGKHA